MKGFAAVLGWILVAVLVLTAGSLGGIVRVISGENAKLRAELASVTLINDGSAALISRVMADREQLREKLKKVEAPHK